MKACGLILARASSYPIPRKNLVPLAGKPLVLYTFEAALQAETLERTFVSTDDEEIARLARENGIEVPFMRPAELSEEGTPHLAVVRHFAQWLEENAPGFDLIVGLQPSSPFRGPQIIDEAVNKMRETGAEAVVSVCQPETIPEWMLVPEGERVRFFAGKNAHMHFVPRQLAPKYYMQNGAVEVYRRDIVLTQESLYGSGQNIRSVIMDRVDSIEIVTELDLAIAEAIMQKRLQGDSL